MKRILRVFLVALALAALPSTGVAEEDTEGSEDEDSGPAEDAGPAEEPAPSEEAAAPEEAEDSSAAFEAMKPLSPRVGREALVLLSKAKSSQKAGKLPHARALSEQAVKIAPRLGAAHAVLANLLVASGEPVRAEREYRIAVALIEQPDQPKLRNSYWGAQAKDPTELAGDTYVQWGMCLVELAKAADGDSDSSREQAILRKARDAFHAGLSRKPRSELRTQAKEMLARFKR